MIASTPDGPRTDCRDFPCDPAATGAARRMAHDAFTAWGLPAEFVEDLVLVVSELVANATAYGEPPIRLSLWGTAEEVCVRVTDHGPGRPRRLDLGQEAVHGRGLTIVEALADRWGAIPAVGKVGKTVWAAWRLPREGSEAPRPTDHANLIPASRTASEV